MIITVTKPITRILESLRLYQKVYIVGCAACATKCQTGDEQAVLRMKAELEANGKEVKGYAVLDTPCDMRIVKRDLGRPPEVKSSDAILVLACGSGVQAIEKVINMPVIPGLDPLFLGTTERIGIHHEYCKSCGDCILHLTGGICPVTRCTKGLINGPCGGAVNGKCEVNTELDCAWCLIYEKLKTRKEEKNALNTYMEPRNHAKPGKIDSRKRRDGTAIG